MTKKREKPPEDERKKNSSIPEVLSEESLKSRWVQRSYVTLFLGGQVLFRLLRGKIHLRNLLEEMAEVGPDSLTSVLLIAYFAGMIFTIQTARELTRFGALQALGGAFGLAFCRELAPVLTAGIIAGQIGSAFAAEIGEMQVTEQIDALYTLRTDPVDYLVTPRVLACCIMLPILTILSLVVGICGGIFVATYFYNQPPQDFLNSLKSFLDIRDLVSILIKGVVFGALVSLIGCGWGLTTKGGAKGVSRSCTAAVVSGWIAIFMVNFFLSLAIFQELNINPARGF